MSGNPNYLYSYPLKMLIWISVFVIVFNMNVRWMYSNPIFSIIRIRHYPKYPTKGDKRREEGGRKEKGDEPN
jgi:hypothetical protein